MAILFLKVQFFSPRLLCSSGPYIYSTHDPPQTSRILVIDCHPLKLPAAKHHTLTVLGTTHEKLSLAPRKEGETDESSSYSCCCDNLGNPLGSCRALTPSLISSFNFSPKAALPHQHRRAAPTTTISSAAHHFSFLSSSVREGIIFSHRAPLNPADRSPALIYLSETVDDVFPPREGIKETFF